MKKFSTIVCIAKDEDHYIEEWLDYHEKLGFDEVVMYVNDWVCPVDRPFLKKIQFDGLHKQMGAYRHFTTNYRNDYVWAAFLDCDEFLVLKKHSNVKDFLTEYDNPVGLGVNWQYFGSCGLKDRNSNSLIKNFTKKQSGVDKHIKTIMKLSGNGYMVSPHNPNTPLMDTNKNFFIGPFNINGNVNTVQINHYHHKTYDDWIVRCNRGQSDNTETKKPEQWFQNVEKHNEIEDLTALNFMYKQI